MATDLKGKLIAEEIIKNVREEVEKLDQKITLTGVMIGEKEASQVYVSNTIRACGKAGILSNNIMLPKDITEPELILEIEKLNADPAVTGILLQLPLPAHINELTVLKTLSYKKDVDGFNPYNAGLLSICGGEALFPCTAAGIVRLLKISGIEIEGKNCVVIGRSNIVGKPVANLLLKENATVTITHSKTQNIGEITKRADIVIAALGKPKFLTGGMIKKGSCIIDVGTNVVDGVLCGDADYDSCAAVCGYITPVPGGVGSMTNAILMENCLKAYRLQNIE